MSTRFNFALIPAVIYSAAGIGLAVMVAREAVQEAARRHRRAAQAIKAAEEFQAERGRRDAAGWPFSRLLTPEEQAALRDIEQHWTETAEEPAQGGPEGAGK